MTSGASRALAALVLVASLAGCGEPGSAGPAAGPGPDAPTSTAPPAALGSSAPSQTVRFAPRRIRLPGGATAPVRPAVTVGGRLRVPEDVAAVGWWDGSAYAGDPFGHTVVAGHVDSATQGLGFFARLLSLRRGDEVGLSGGGHRAVYRVLRVRAVDKEALAVSSGAFDQRGPHRLVLITCTGTYDRERMAYTQNLVVTAVPVGPAG